MVSPYNVSFHMCLTVEIGVKCAGGGGMMCKSER